LLEEALSISRELGDRLNAAWALVYLGTVVDAVGDYAPAQSFLEEGLAIARELGDVGRIITGVALAFLGDGPLYLGDNRRALQLYEESTDILRKIKDKNYLAYPLRRLGYIALHQGNAVRANELFRESLALNQEVGHQTGVIACLAALATTHVARGMNTPAAQLFGAVSTLLSTRKFILLSFDQIEYDHYLSTVRAQLDSTAFDAAWEAGHTMTLQQAIAFAIDVKMSNPIR
jgi:tetratricopeptide (TPR) repeat protein